MSMEVNDSTVGGASLRLAPGLSFTNFQRVISRTAERPTEGGNSLSGPHIDPTNTAYCYTRLGPCLTQTAQWRENSVVIHVPLLTSRIRHNDVMAHCDSSSSSSSNTEVFTKIISMRCHCQYGCWRLFWST